MQQYCNSEKNPHIDIPAHTSVNYINFMKDIAWKLKFYMNIINAEQKDALIALLGKTENLLFNIIYYLIVDKFPTDNTHIYELITNLRRSFVYDTEHDFGVGTSRDECKNVDIGKCITSLKGGDVSLHHYLVHVMNDGIVGGIVNNCIHDKGGEVVTVTDECRDTFNSICYTIRDTKIKGIAKSTLDISTGGKTLYKAISSIIDPAGCSSDNLETPLINPDLELHIYNIGLIFYQCFYTDFYETDFYESKWLLFIKFSADNVHNLYKKKKIFNLFI